MKGGGLALKSLQWFLRIVEFCCAAIVLAIFSYFLATLHNHDLNIATYIRAVEGISGAAVLYTIVGLLLLCCLAGVAIFSSIAILLDIAFCGAFVYIAWAARGGASSCNGQVRTPFGNGNTRVDNSVPDGSGGFTSLPSLHQACRLNTAVFAVAIVACVFFLLSAFVEVGLIRHHKKEKAFGPSPNNGYTAGSPRRKFWQRKNKNAYPMSGGVATKPDALPHHSTLADARTSYATDTTAVGHDQPVYNKYGNTAAAPQYGQQTGTAQPYNTTRTTNGTF
ncbi:hypothetical protein PVAG01_06782 [Phlyctema vagabunda]|uniref:MARVEL domain-containing protein n=1 Tax=Phlyctema vagabunda TaxID=108571 RepID=A0ABR4PH09_9HELO